MPDAPPPTVPGAAPTQARTKIAVLGAGMGAIAATCELTALPENRDKYDITIYTLGWRVGGKGASARNQQLGGRIEEHGLHLWFGFYDNSFKIMKDAYREMQRSPELPLSTFETAFTPHDYVVVMDNYKGEWRTPWEYTFPANAGVPGDGADLPSFWTMAWMAINYLFLECHTVLVTSRQPCGDDVDAQHLHTKEGWWDSIKDVIGDADHRIHDLETVAASEMLALAMNVASSLRNRSEPLEDAAVGDVENAVCTLLSKYRAWLWDKYGCHVDDDLARRYLTLTDMGTTVISGC
jgi:uncharacterized protein with NAD-binding domain and iron-sulfur cluster